MNRSMYTLILIATISACSGSGSNAPESAPTQDNENLQPIGDEPETEIPSESEPTVEEPIDETPAVSEPTAEAPSSAEVDSSSNQLALQALRLYKISYRCAPYLKEFGGSQTATFNDTFWHGSFRSAPEVWFADNVGRKLEQQGHRSTTITRNDFGDKNVIIECDNTEYGVLRAFIPAIGGITSGLAEDFNTPPWLAKAGGGLFNPNDAHLIVSVQTDLIHRTYQVLAEEYEAQNGELLAEDIDTLLQQARDIVNSVEGMDSEFIIDSQYFLSPGSIDDSRDRNAEVFLEIARSMEQARFFAETERAADGKIEPIMEELAVQLMGGARSRNFGELLAVSYFPEISSSVVTDPRFDDELEHWKEYDNTGSSNLASSEQYLLNSDNKNTIGLEIVSNSVIDGVSFQRGFYQQVDIDNASIDEYYFKVQYTELLGLLEESRSLIDILEDSGVAVFSIEYLDSSGESLGYTQVVNTTDAMFADTGFYSTPVSLQSEGNGVIYRVPSIGNNGLVLNIGKEARLALGDGVSEVDHIFVDALVGDYIASDYLRHFLTGIILIEPECFNCRASLKVNSLDVRKIVR